MTSQIEAAEREGLTLRKQMVNGKWSHQWHAECDVCGALSPSVTHKPNAPAQAIINSFKAKGWSVHKGLCHCPQHVSKRKEQDTMTQPTTKQVLAVLPLLQQHFRADPGHYVNGWTDAKIAHQASVPEAIVKAVREDGFGPIKVDPDVQALRDEMRIVEEMLRDMAKRMDTLEKKRVAA